MPWTRLGLGRDAILAGGFDTSLVLAYDYYRTDQLTVTYCFNTVVIPLL